jgi:hypothetical protein
MIDPDFEVDRGLILDRHVLALAFTALHPIEVVVGWSYGTAALGALLMAAAARALRFTPPRIVPIPSAPLDLELQPAGFRATLRGPHHLHLPSMLRLLVNTALTTTFVYRWVGANPYWAEQLLHDPGFLLQSLFRWESVVDAFVSAGVFTGLAMAGAFALHLALAGQRPAVPVRLEGRRLWLGSAEILLDGTEEPVVTRTTIQVQDVTVGVSGPEVLWLAEQIRAVEPIGTEADVPAALQGLGRTE